MNLEELEKELQPWQREILARAMSGKRLVIMTPRRDPFREVVRRLAAALARGERPDR